MIMDSIVEFATSDARAKGGFDGAKLLPSA
jgi:hypothetical protein